MTEVFLSVAVLGAAVAMMAIGVILGRSPVKGSCGGLSAIGMKGACDICGGDTSRCESNTAAPEKVASQDLAYDASSAESTSKR